MRSTYIGQLITDLAGGGRGKPSQGRLQLFEYDRFGVLFPGPRVVTVLNYGNASHAVGTTVVVGVGQNTCYVVLYEGSDAEEE